MREFAFLTLAVLLVLTIASGESQLGASNQKAMTESRLKGIFFTCLCGLDRETAYKHGRKPKADSTLIDNGILNFCARSFSFTVH